MRWARHNIRWAPNVRAMAILQLLLGNIGVPGGASTRCAASRTCKARRTWRSCSTTAGLFGLPSDAQADLKTYNAKFDATSYWSNGPRFFVSLTKAWFGDAATKGNDYAFQYLPRPAATIPGLRCLRRCTRQNSGLICMVRIRLSAAQCPARTRRPGQTQWMVVMDLFGRDSLFLARPRR